MTKPRPKIENLTPSASPVEAIVAKWITAVLIIVFVSVAYFRLERRLIELEDVCAAEKQKPR